MIIINKLKTYDLYKKHVNYIIKHFKIDLYTINKPLRHCVNLLYTFKLFNLINVLTIYISNQHIYLVFCIRNLKIIVVCII